MGPSGRLRHHSSKGTSKENRGFKNMVTTDSSTVVKIQPMTNTIHSLGGKVKHLTNTIHSLGGKVKDMANNSMAIKSMAINISPLVSKSIIPTPSGQSTAAG